MMLIVIAWVTDITTIMISFPCSDGGVRVWEGPPWGPCGVGLVESWALFTRRKQISDNAFMWDVLHAHSPS